MDARRNNTLVFLAMTACISQIAAAAPEAPTAIAPAAPQPAVAAPIPAPVEVPVAAATPTPVTAPASTTPTQTPSTTQSNTPAPAAMPATTMKADDSRCPCDYNEAEAVATFRATLHGAVMCSLGSVKMIGDVPAANGAPVQATNTVLLMTIDKDKAASAKDQAEAAKLSMTTWLAGFGGDPTKEATNYCTKNKWDPASKKDILTLKQYQSCLQDIKHAAKAIGLTCGEE
jgi:hypothetical protein